MKKFPRFMNFWSGRDGLARSFAPYIPLGISVLLGVFFTLTLFITISKREYQQIRKDFNIVSRNRISLIEREIEQDLLLLKALHSFYAGSVEVTHEEFAVFVKLFLSHPSSVQALQWAPRVLHGDRKKFELQKPDKHFKELLSFQITELNPQAQTVTAAKRDEYFPATFVEPHQGNEYLMGLDLASIPSCRETLNKARDNGQIQTSSRLMLERKISCKYGIMIFLPIYQTKTPPETIDARRKYLQGFIVGLYSIHDILEQALSYLNPEDVDIYVYECSDSNAKTFLDSYLSGSNQSDEQPSFNETEYMKSPLTQKARILLPGREWLVVCTAAKSYIAQRRTWQRWIILTLGLLSTALLSSYFWFSIGRTKRIERLIDDRTQQLKKANEDLENDIINRKSVERALRAERDFAESLIETAQTIVLVLDPKARIVRFNPYMEKISGYTLEEVRGKDWLTTFLPERDHDRIRKIFLQAIDNIPTKGNVNPIVTKDQRERQIEWHSKTLKNGDGETIGLMAIGQDITERKQREQEVIELNRSLRDQYKELETLLYVTSHDLRTPLVNIQGFSQELFRACETINTTLERAEYTENQKELASVLQEDIPEALQYIQVSANKMDSLLNSILRLSRLGQAALTIKPLEMNQLMTDIVKSMEYQFKQADAELEIGNLPNCIGDTDQIDQVFSNLLDNTLKYLDIKRKGVIKISGHAEGNHAIYCVQDNGIGISENHLDKIFELFHQLDPSENYGQGLGLTIARRIVNRHNGEIWVASTPGMGSKFFIKLPAT